MSRAPLPLLLLAAACSSSNDVDAASDASVIDGSAGDAAPMDAAYHFDCIDSTPPTHLVEDFCRTAEGGLDYTGTCYAEDPSNEY